MQPRLPLIALALLAAPALADALAAAAPTSQPASGPAASAPGHGAPLVNLTPALALPAVDWPQFRGPTGDGLAVATNLPLTWSATQNVKWKAPVPGRGRSSPVLLGDRIWLTTALETGLKIFADGPDRMQQAERVAIGVVCLERATGRQLYHVELFAVDDPAPVNLLNSYATPTPVVEPGRVYCDFGTFGTACLDSATGHVLWKRQFPLDHHHGPGSSPILYQDLLILVRDGRDQQYVMALHKQTGETAWKTDRPPLSTPIREFRKSFSTPLVFEAAGRVQMVVPGAQWLVAYEPETGKEIWRVDDGKGETVAPRPVYGRGLVYLSTGVLGGRAQLWAVRVDGQGDVTQTHVAWKLPAPIGFIPLFDGKTLAGWEGLDGFWSVKDGAISGAETKEHPAPQTFLILAASQADPARFGDFELHYQYKFATPDGNSGVQFRSKVLDPKTCRVGGYQADFDAGCAYDGSIYDEGGVAGGRGTMSNRGDKTHWTADTQRQNEKLAQSNAELKKEIKKGDWNEAVLVVKGNHVTYTINGHLMTDLTDDSPKARRDGVIALQLHAGFVMDVQFKDIKIKLLPAGAEK